MLRKHEERYSRIIRWSLINTIQKQTLSDHLFRVAIIAARIAKQHYELTFEDELALYQYALHHDDVELFSGDFPTMVKDCVDEATLLNRYADMLGELNPDPLSTIREIVKLADYVEACMFLATEKSMGNDSVAHHYAYMMGRLQSYCGKIGKEEVGVKLRIQINHFAFSLPDPLDRRDDV